jgi:hypothetical protein
MFEKYDRFDTLAGNSKILEMHTLCHCRASQRKPSESQGTVNTAGVTECNVKDASMASVPSSKEKT